MLKLTKKTEYALIALSHLSHAEGNNTINVREISDHNNIPFPVLSKVLQQLAQKDFVEPVKGARGGYHIKGDLSKQNLLQFLERMEGPIGLVDCITVHGCTHSDTCVIRSPLQIINDTIISVFNEMSLADVIKHHHFAPDQIPEGISGG